MRMTPRTNCLHEREHLLSAPAATSVSPTELRERLNSVAPPRLLDVRTPAEFQTAHIPGAYNVPLDIVRVLSSIQPSAPSSDRRYRRRFQRRDECGEHRAAERSNRCTSLSSMTNLSVGRGVAYRSRRPEYLLNVAARNMSAFPHEPDHFLQWLRTRSEFELSTEIELRERFVPRQIYGDYLRSIVQHHLQSPGEVTPASCEFVIGEAVDVEPQKAGLPRTAGRRFDRGRRSRGAGHRQ